MEKIEERNCVELVWLQLERHKVEQVFWNQIVQDFVCQLYHFLFFIFSPLTTHTVLPKAQNTRIILLTE